VKLVGQAGWFAFAQRQSMPEEFAQAMDDDLGTPGAMAVLFNTIKQGNVAIDAGDTEAATAALAAVSSMLDVLGLLRESDSADAGEQASLRPVVDGLVAAILTQRQEARARKDWAAADAIRDQLSEIGLKITDTPNGPEWALED
jgi:cysteinyl-tRNA synthetase